MRSIVILCSLCSLLLLAGCGDLISAPVPLTAQGVSQPGISPTVFSDPAYAQFPAAVQPTPLAPVPDTPPATFDSLEQRAEPLPADIPPAGGSILPEGFTSPEEHSPEEHSPEEPGPDPLAAEPADPETPVEKSTPEPTLLKSAKPAPVRRDVFILYYSCDEKDYLASLPERDRNLLQKEKEKWKAWANENGVTHGEANEPNSRYLTLRFVDVKRDKPQRNYTYDGERQLPTVVFVDADGHEFGHYVGYANFEAVTDYWHKIIRKRAKVSIPLGEPQASAVAPVTIPQATAGPEQNIRSPPAGMTPMEGVQSGEWAQSAEGDWVCNGRSCRPARRVRW